MNSLYSTSLFFSLVSYVYNYSHLILANTLAITSRDFIRLYDLLCAKESYNLIPYIQLELLHQGFLRCLSLFSKLTLLHLLN